MRSTEKIWQLVEQLENSDEAELREAFPALPPAVVQMALPVVTSQLPQDPDELDAFLEQVGDFCHSLRSDNAPAV